MNLPNQLNFSKLILLLCFSNSIFAGDLPNEILTPGVVRDVDVVTLCTSSTKLVRHTSSAIKAEVYAEYGMVKKHDDKCTGPSHSCFEVDHLIPLEIGGADVKENLWPQEYEVITDDPSWQRNGAHKKDSLENRLHKLICNNTITMQEAQSCIASDWIACYEKTFK